MIWAMVLPNRVVELNIPEFAVRPGDCTFAWTSIVNNKAPLVSQVCWEAHGVALKHCTRNSDKQRAKDLGLKLPHQTSDAGPMPVSLVWSSNNHPLVKPDKGHLWFNAARDTIILYHSPYWERRSAWFALQSRIALYGYLAADRAVYASMWNPWPRCMRHFNHHVLASAPAVPWADPIFVLRIVAIHATEEEARVSGLFGFSGDEHIQLIDPQDINLLMEFFLLTRATFHEQGPSTVAFFEGLRANVGKWESQVMAWRRDAMTRELWLLWIKEYHQHFSGIDHPEDVFSGPRSRHGVDLDMRDPASYRSPLTHGPIDLEQYGPNENHPWVADALANLPTFRHRIQFRHCALRCISAPTWLTEA
ncbi:hypothetical protein N7526_011059 [Penicillium atrosanguineum]|nr:hypothetical protein N7526_011059 [Penicillium atrosanguineum]